MGIGAPSLTRLYSAAGNLLVRTIYICVKSKERPLYDEPFRADARQETTVERARRILNEELDKLGWADAELEGRAKGDARKIQIARRLRVETTVTLKWIAAELHMGTWTHVANRLSEKPTQNKHQPNLMLCQK